jgi:hypothetical protein
MLVPLWLWHVRVNGDSWETALLQVLTEGISSVTTAHEDDDLVELDTIEKAGQLLNLPLLIDFNVVLLKTVEHELGLVVDALLNWLQSYN